MMVYAFALKEPVSVLANFAIEKAEQEETKKSKGLRVNRLMAEVLTLFLY